MEMPTQPENSNPANATDTAFLGSRSSLYDLLCQETPSWNGPKNYETSSGTRGRLEKLMSQPSNKTVRIVDLQIQNGYAFSSRIADTANVEFMVDHSYLVLSVKLDEWTEDQVDTLETLGGNSVVNEKYEACLPNRVMKPKPGSSTEERTDFIRRKYELPQFLNSDDRLSCPFPTPCRRQPSLQNTCSSSNSSQDKKIFEKQTTRHRIGLTFRNSWGRKEPDPRATKKSISLAGMVEFVGLIKVNVVRGTNLAIRDVLSSDPYVILALGHQSVKTRVIKNNLNPVWNESLMLSIPEHIPPLKVLVYDKDTFSTDDFMGEAEIDIQPLVSAAKAYEKSDISEPMQLGKWVATKKTHL